MRIISVRIISEVLNPWVRYKNSSFLFSTKMLSGQYKRVLLKIIEEYENYKK